MANRRSAFPTSVTLLTMLLIPTLYMAGEASGATLTTIYSFKGGAQDGANPLAGVLISASGVLYGTTVYGGIGGGLCGSIGCGTVFSLAPPAAPGDSWTQDVFSFAPRGTAYPYGGVVERNGVLYGTTYADTGQVFALKPPATPGGQWIEERIGTGGPPVLYPEGTLAIGPGGVLYGTSYEGGLTYDEGGDVFSVTPPASPGGAWTTTALCNLSVGVNPTTGVVIGSGGILYGTTYAGNGSVYSLAPPASPGAVWTQTLLHGFAGAPDDGAHGSTGVVIGPGGVLFGATSNGGTGPCSPNSYQPGCGVVYSLRPPAVSGGDWIETILHDFSGGSDGAYPNAVVIGPGGILYGTTSSGGTSNYGNVYSLTPPTSPGGTWTQTILYSFTGGNDGASPAAGLAVGRDGTLYGTTYSGGSSNLGTVFSLTP